MGHERPASRLRHGARKTCKPIEAWGRTWYFEDMIQQRQATSNRSVLMARLHAWLLLCFCWFSPSNLIQQGLSSAGGRRPRRFSLACAVDADELSKCISEGAETKPK
uniref:Uncharacterized protein n=1 Tax=Meloidogyne hapla TaxID=6305 RepID=A0A1I8BU28_MELHA